MRCQQSKELKERVYRATNSDYATWPGNLQFPRPVRCPWGHFLLFNSRSFGGNFALRIYFARCLRASSTHFVGSYVTPHRANTLCEQNPNSLLCVFNMRMRDGFSCETGSTNAKKCPYGHFLRWWNRRELNPRPKTPWYNLLRGQSFF